MKSMPLKSLIKILALLLFAFPAHAAPVTWALQPEPQFPPRSPADDVAPEILRAHAALVCWANGIKSMTPDHEGTTLRGVTLHVENRDCLPEAIDLHFDLRSIHGRYQVLELVSPQIQETPLAGYPGASLVLSLIGSEFEKPSTGIYFQRFYTFRLILDHDYDYEPTRYGDVVFSFESLHGWREVDRELLDSYVVDDPANCDPRFPDVRCPYTVLIYKETVRNTFTGEIYTYEFQTTRRGD